jgi:hypothetical protein
VWRQGVHGRYNDCLEGSVVLCILLLWKVVVVVAVVCQGIINLEEPIRLPSPHRPLISKIISKINK